MDKIDLSNVETLYCLSKTVTEAIDFAIKYKFKGGIHNIYVIHNFDRICGLRGKGNNLYVLPRFNEVPQYFEILRYAKTRELNTVFVND